MGFLFTERMGILFTEDIGNILTEPRGNILVIYTSLVIGFGILYLSRSGGVRRGLLMARTNTIDHKGQRQT